VLGRSTALPDGVEPVRMHTTRGQFAALAATPAIASHGLVLLVPGYTGSKEDFAPLLPLLARGGWLALAYDQRGQYETPAGPGADFSLDSLAADARAMAASADGPGRTHLLGHSFGGLVAQAAVVRAPEAWDRVTLLCTGPGAFDDPEQRQDLTDMRELLARHPSDEVHDIRLQQKRDRGEKEEPAEVAEFLRRRFVASSAACIRAFAGHLLKAPDMVDEVAATKVPAIVVRGAQDDVWSWAAQDDMARRLGTEVMVIEDAAHSPAFENPQALAAVLLA
jgi:pimeloyl-ACP methyl ester carboxylesterase